MSLMRQPLSLWLRLTQRRALARLTHPAGMRRKFETEARIFFRGPRLARRWHSVAGRPALHLNSGAAAPRLLYFHGGAYMFGSPRTHAAMLSVLAKHTGAEAILPQYRLAPEHPFPAAFDDAVAIYRALAAQGPLILGGDSAGGGLALALLAHILHSDLPRPLGVFVFAPLTDMSFTAPSITENAHSESILPSGQIGRFADLVLNGHAPDDPRISPLGAAFAGAPPVAIYVSDSEILRDDSLRMADRLRGFGADVSLTVEPGLPHVWPLFHNLLPEARRTLRDLARWITSLPRSSDS